MLRRQHGHSWFLKLTTRETFVRHAANLCWVKQYLQQQFTQVLQGFNDNAHTLTVLLNSRCGAVNPLQLDGLLAI
jgi:hypothetical protein